MTEAEWLTSDYPTPMLEFLRGWASDRKLRLFAVACCRGLLPWMKDDRGREAIEIAERYADGSSNKAALKRARQAVRAARYALSPESEMMNAEWSAYWLSEVAATENAYAMVGDEMLRLVGQGVLASAVDRVLQARVWLMDIFNPFRPVAIDPAWRAGPVLAIATAIYEERSFDRLPELAASLVAAGCSDAAILGHCRSGGEHVRGCWVVDAVLGKA